METEYFWLKAEDKIPIGIELPPFTAEESSGKEPVICFISSKEKKENLVFLDYISPYLLHNRYHLISDRLKELFSIYVPGNEWVSAVLIDQEKEQYLYWFCTPEVVDCLHPETKKDIGGAVKDPVLDSMKLGRQSLFQVKTEKQSLIFIRLDLAESILRRGFTGIKLVRVSRKEERNG